MNPDDHHHDAVILGLLKYLKIENDIMTENP